jgi:hypothetical protein
MYRIGPSEASHHVGRPVLSGCGRPHAVAVFRAYTLHVGAIRRTVSARLTATGRHERPGGEVPRAGPSQ